MDFYLFRGGAKKKGKEFGERFICLETSSITLYELRHARKSVFCHMRTTKAQIQVSS